MLLQLLVARNILNLLLKIEAFYIQMRLLFFQREFFWVNEFGAFIFNGEGAPINLIDNKIDNNEWAEFIQGTHSITGYYPKEKRLIVVGEFFHSFSMLQILMKYIILI